MENEHQWALDTSEALRDGRFGEVNMEEVAQRIHGIATGYELNLLAQLTKMMLAVMSGERVDADLALIDIRWILERNPTVAGRLTQDDVDECYRNACELYMIDEPATAPPATHPYSVRWILDHEDLP